MLEPSRKVTIIDFAHKVQSSYVQLTLIGKYKSTKVLLYFYFSRMDYLIVRIHYYRDS